MKKTFLLITLFFALFIGTSLNNTAFAQDSETTKKANSFDPYWYLNLNAGRSLLYGDFMSTPLDLAKLGKQTGFNAGLLGGWQFSSVVGLRAQLIFGTLHGRIESIGQRTKAHYSSYFIEPTIDFTNLFAYNADRKFFLYGFTGIGFTNIYADRTNSPNTYKSGTGALAGISVGSVPVGVGAKYKFDDNWGVNLEVTDFTGLKSKDGDKLDGLIQGTKRDVAEVISIGINYDFAEATNLKKMADNYNLIKYEVTPNPLEMHNDSIVVTVKGTVPEKYFAKKAAILITPELKYNGGTYLLTPVTLKGEDVNGPGTAIPYKTGGTFTFQQTIPYTQGMAASDLMVTPIIYKPAAANIDPNATAQQIHANNKYVDVPAHKIADGVIVTPSLIIHDEDLLTAADKFVKEKIASKDALIYFKVNKYNLDWKLTNNKKNTGAFTALNEFINKGWQIKNINVDGYSSPEGEESFNQGLSAKRAETGKQYVINMFKKWSEDKKATDFQKSLSGVMINTASHGEDWDGFMLAVQASNLKDKEAIINIVNSESDLNKREQGIRNMTRVFKVLATEILPPLRRVDITVNTYEPIKTDEQLLNIASSNSETLSLEELLYSATLTKDSKVQLDIYKLAMNQYSDDWRAFNNAGNIELQNGNINQAATYLDKANTLSPNNVIVLNNLGAVQAKKGNLNAAVELFNKAQGLGANETYNTGITQITKGKYSDAVSSLNAKNCNHNLGLAQLLSGNSQAAIVTLKCAPATADNYYLLAVAGARTNDTALLYDSLSKAVKMNDGLKMKAAEDREFLRYFNVTEFQMIVK